MDNNLIDSILRICKILNKYSVQYLIVGGAAVALHGYFRMSMKVNGLLSDKYDIDIWYNPTYDNYFKLLDALAELGHDIAAFKEEMAPNPKKSFFKFETEDFTLDFLPLLKGLSQFRMSFENRETINFNDIDMFFIGYDDLIKDKEATGRQKDIEDIDQLKKNNKK